jgi:hypothetical protein
LLQQNWRNERYENDISGYIMHLDQHLIHGVYGTDSNIWRFMSICGNGGLLMPVERLEEDSLASIPFESNERSMMNNL